MNDKKLKSINNNNNSNNEIDFRRDSLSDRICDHLFEVLLKYLSFKEKICFECVSKQFQRLVFNKQFVVDIDDYKGRLNPRMKRVENL